MAIIQDGSGKSYGVKVDSNNRLHGFSTVQTSDREAALDGRTWSYTFTETATGANDLFFYLKNTGTNNLHITDLRVSSTVATRLDYLAVEGTPTYTAETAVSPVNRNVGSSKIPDATCNRDADITNLTVNGVIFIEEIPVVSTRYHLRTTSNIILPQGSAFAIRRSAATGAVTVVLSAVEVEAL